jgi:protein involved in polysaccharide export with SLBB domain
VRAARPFLAFLLLCISGAPLAQEAEVPPADQAAYRLGPSDVIIVTVHNHEDLSGTLRLDGSGLISMPLIGQVPAEGLTAEELVSRVENLFKPDYLVNPRVTVQIQNYRPYYLIGEVDKTGAFNYVQGMTFMRAIAIAGGYSYRAKKGVVFVQRGEGEDEVKMNVDERAQPGDIIRVKERLF